MAILTATELAKSFGPADIFEGINLSIPKKGRIAIVGANGVGKTTLLKILAGVEEPSAGNIHRSKNLRMAYLPQVTAHYSGGSLWSLCLEAFQGLLALESNLKSLETAMQTQSDDLALLELYGSRQAEYEHKGGYTYENRIRQTLTGLGFEAADFQRPLSQFSGGERTRARLAKLILDDPDLLLLDEPTNHLDINAVEWLEAYLKDWQGAVLVVSHDRYFLDQFAETIWEMTPSLESYRGNYSAFVRQREERYKRLLAEYQSQAEFIEKEENYIRRNIAGQNTAQAKGRQRRLSRLLEEAQLTRPIHKNRRMHLHLDTLTRSGDLVLRTYNLQVGYQDEGRPLFHCPDLILRRGECTAIIGPNGAGKTTFLKTILNIIPPFAGETELGASLKIAYFAQAHEGLIASNTLLEEIDTVAPNLLPAEARNYLAKFLFTGEDVFRRVETLSGGERGRLALAKLSLTDANLLLLDEPTNHLDLATQEVLQSVLADYRGTILIVSHDRYLIDALATQIWEVDPKSETLFVFEGSYTEYKDEKTKRLSIISEVSNLKKPVANQAIKDKPSPALSRNQMQQVHKKMNQCEVKIQVKEIELSKLTAALENPPTNALEVQKLSEKYNSTKAELDDLLKEWEKVASLLQ